VTKPMTKYELLEGTTSLHLAMAFSTPAVVGLLLDANANPEAKDAYDHPVVFSAACWNNPDTIRFWFNRLPEANVNERACKYKNSNLIIACVWHSIEAASALIALKADVNQTNNTDADALLCTFCRPGVPIGLIELLLSSKANVNVSGGWRGSKANMLYHRLQFLMQGSKSSELTKSKVLCKGNTPLHSAAAQGMSLIVTALMQATASPDTKNDCDYTALDLADYFGPYPAVTRAIWKELIYEI